MKIRFRAYFHVKDFQKIVGRKFIRVRIGLWTRSKIVGILNTGEQINVKTFVHI
jgi:hypothetical protein